MQNKVNLGKPENKAREKIGRTKRKTTEDEN
jgi:hypothetical protein